MFFPVTFGACSKAFATGTLPATLNWGAAVNNGTIWVAAGIAANLENPVAYSQDGGATWTAGTGAFTDVFNSRGVAWNGTTWAVQGADSGTHKAMTSLNGIDWTQRTQTGWGLATTTSNGFIAVSGNFYGVGNLVSRTLYYAANGFTFSSATNVLPNSGQAWDALASDGATTAVVVGGSNTGDTSVAGKILIANLPTGTWTQTAMPQSAGWRYVIWTGTIYFAVAGAGIGAKSTDGGDTWSALTLPTATEDAGTVTRYGLPCATTDGKIILPIETKSNSQTTALCYMSCDDGANWQQVGVGQQGLWAASGSDGSAVVIVSTTAGGGDNKVSYST